MLLTVTPHRFSATVRGLFRLTGVIVLAVLTGVPAFAQAPSEPPTAVDEGTETEAPDDAAPDGEASPTETPADSGQPETPNADAIEGRSPNAPPKATGAELPPDFTPPAAPSEVMTLQKPLMTQADITKEQNDLRRLAGGYDRVIRTGDLNAETREVLARYARLQIARLTAVNFASAEEKRKVADITRETLLNLRNAGAGQGNENRLREFREAFYAEMVKAAAEALDNNFYVRMQIATILSQLNSREAPISGREPPVSYVPAMTPLLDMLIRPDQPEAVKIAAAAGISRIAEFADSIPVELRYRAGEVLAKELARPDTHPWYQMRLAEAMAELEFDFDRNRNPLVLDGLMDALADGNRQCLARSAAAKALARTPAPPNVWNDKLVATSLVQFARDMSENYNKQPNRVEWFNCYKNLYLAFVPAPNEDINRLPTSALLRKGSLTGSLDAAHKLIQPIVAHVFNQPHDPKKPHAPIPTELIQALDEFLKANQQP